MNILVVAESRWCREGKRSDCVCVFMMERVYV